MSDKNIKIEISIYKDLKRFSLWMLGLFFVFALISKLVIDVLPINRDDTDGEWPNRSGLKVYTDALTGCQYLSNGSTLTNRMDIDGSQIGCKDNQIKFKGYYNESDI